jgi:hypothetical protein
MAKAQGTIQDICERLTDVFRQAVPRQQDADKGRKRLSEKEIASTIESGLKRFYEAARIEREQNRLGVINRARVAFGLQQRLLDAGYPPALVKQVLFAMLVSAFVGKKQ